MLYQPKIYKPCERKCGTCKPCKEFQKIVKQIDLTKVSKYEIETRNKKF